MSQCKFSVVGMCQCAIPLVESGVPCEGMFVDRRCCPLWAIPAMVREIGRA